VRHVVSAGLKILFHYFASSALSIRDAVVALDCLSDVDEIAQQIKIARMQHRYEWKF
jgi:hypothetical protein